MNNQSDDLDAEERKVLQEAFSDGEVRVGPSEEYVAELRRRLLSVASPARVIPTRPSRRVLLGSIIGAGIAAIVLAAMWFSNAEPAWASAIRMAREQAWVHAWIEQDGVATGELWVSPEQDIVGAKVGTTALFLDYKRQTFSRCDLHEGVVYRASQPETMHLTRDLSSVATLASVFRRSPAGPSLLPDQLIERWSLRGSIVDGIPCDEYEIIVRPRDGAPTTLVLTIDRRRSLPRSLTISEAKSHTMTCQFDYPAMVRLDERSVGIPVDARIVDVDKANQLTQSLREGRENFDDYTALCVTSRSDDPRPLFDVKRVLRRASKWRVDDVSISDPQLIWPNDHDEALVYGANRFRFHFVPTVICDSRVIRFYKWQGKISADGQPCKVVSLNDESTADAFFSALLVPERCCRPIFHPGAFDPVAHEKENPLEGLIKVDVFATPNTKSRKALSQTYWLDPNLGNVAVRKVSHVGASTAADPNQAPSRLSEIVFLDFRQSPRGYWYPTVISRDPSAKSSKGTTHIYVDFTDVPPDELFGPINPTP